MAKVTHINFQCPKCKKIAKDKEMKAKRDMKIFEKVFYTISCPFCSHIGTTKKYIRK